MECPVGNFVAVVKKYREPQIRDPMNPEEVF
jgi:hypothetical protein